MTVNAGVVYDNWRAARYNWWPPYERDPIPWWRRPQLLNASTPDWGYRIWRRRGVPMLDMSKKLVPRNNRWVASYSPRDTRNET